MAPEKEAARRHPWLPAPLRNGLLRASGTETEALLAGARALSDLGRALGGGHTARASDWFRREEWARTAEFVLRRRSKLGLHMTPAEREGVAAAIAPAATVERPAAPPRGERDDRWPPRRIM